MELSDTIGLYLHISTSIEKALLKFISSEQVSVTSP